MDSDHYLTVGEAAKHIRVGPATIRRWLRNGHLTGIQPGGPHGAVRISEREVLRRLREIEPQAERRQEGVA